MTEPSGMDPAPEPDSLPLANEHALSIAKEPAWPTYVIFLGYVGFGVMVVIAVGTASYEMLDALPLVALLAFASHRIGQRIARVDGDPAMVRLVFAAFWAKLVGTLIRAAVVATLYNNRSDSNDFHLWGKSYAPMFRTFDFSHVNKTSGTDFMRVLTGVIYSFTGSSQVSGSIVLAFLSFIGFLLLWRAFKRAVPNGASRRYALLVLFLPSLLYWPSALGKEGWSIFCLGVAGYGVALVLTHKIPKGVLLVALGMVGVTFLRPHVAITMFCGIALAAAVGKSQRPSGKTPILRLVLFGALFVSGIALASSAASFFGVESLNQETINKTLNEAEGRTSEAGSSFAPVSVTSNPANAPLAAVTVLFRPLPFEAGSAVAAATALEGVFLIWLTWSSRRRLRSLGRSMRNQPYIAYCVGILGTFIYAFSAFSNFGILARQRCQVIPFYLALLCLPEWEPRQISIDEALAGRDAPPPDPAESDSSSPVAGEEEPPAPYAEGDRDLDPYERFRDDADRR